MATAEGRVYSSGHSEFCSESVMYHAEQFLTIWPIFHSDFCFLDNGQLSPTLDFLTSFHAVKSSVCNLCSLQVSTYCAVAQFTTQTKEVGDKDW